MRILIADDEPSHRRLLALILEPLVAKPKDIIEAGNGLETIELARCNQPDIILMDVVMKKMDGFTALELLKADETTAGIPVIIITAAYTREQDIERSRELGAVDHVKKPLDIEGLRALVKKHAKKKAWQAGQA